MNEQPTTALQQLGDLAEKLGRKLVAIRQQVPNPGNPDSQVITILEGGHPTSRLEIDTAFQPSLAWMDECPVGLLNDWLLVAIRDNTAIVETSLDGWSKVTAPRNIFPTFQSAPECVQEAFWTHRFDWSPVDGSDEPTLEDCDMAWEDWADAHPEIIAKALAEQSDYLRLHLQHVIEHYAAIRKHTLSVWTQEGK